MTSIRAFVAALAALTAIAACAPMRWEYAGGDPTSAEAAYQDCQHLAARESWYYRNDPFGFIDTPRYVRGRDGRLYAVYDSPRPSFLRRQAIEHDLTNRCMRAKGFRLVPAPN